MHVRVRAALTTALTTAAAAVTLAGCSLAGGGSGESASETTTSPSGSAGGTVVLATHESFHLPKKRQSPTTVPGTIVGEPLFACHPFTLSS